MTRGLYHHATRLVGQPVYVHHVNGAVHHGTLTSVTTQGIYLMPHRPGVRLVVASEPVAVEHALQTNQNAPTDITPVYGPAAFFGFGALAGLTAAAVFSPWWW